MIASSPARNSSTLSSVTPISTVRSPPAKNVFFAEVMITPRTLSRSRSNRSTAAPMAAPYAAFITLAEPGMSRVRVTMPSAPSNA